MVKIASKILLVLVVLLVVRAQKRPRPAKPSLTGCDALEIESDGCGAIPNLEALKLWAERDEDRSRPENINCLLKTFTTQEPGAWTQENLDFCWDAYKNMGYTSADKTCCFKEGMKPLQNLIMDKVRNAMKLKTKFQSGFEKFNRVVQECKLNGKQFLRDKVTDALESGAVTAGLLKSKEQMRDAFKEAFVKLVKSQMQFDIGNVCTICVPPAKISELFDSTNDNQVIINTNDLNAFTDDIVTYMTDIKNVAEDLGIAMKKALDSLMMKYPRGQGADPNCIAAFDVLRSFSGAGLKPRCPPRLERLIGGGMGQGEGEHGEGEHGEGESGGEGEHWMMDGERGEGEHGEGEHRMGGRDPMDREVDDPATDCANKDNLRQSLSLFGDSFYGPLIEPLHRPREIQRPRRGDRFRRRLATTEVTGDFTFTEEGGLSGAITGTDLDQQVEDEGENVNIDTEAVEDDGTSPDSDVNQSTRRMISLLVVALLAVISAVI